MTEPVKTGDSIDRGKELAMSNIDRESKEPRYQNNGTAAARLHGLELISFPFPWGSRPRLYAGARFAGLRQT